MVYYIIIRGPAGVGKTTISNILAKRINADVIHFEEIMNSLGLDYIPGEKWIPLKKFLLAHKQKIPDFRKILKKGRNLIIDHNFYHEKQIEDLTNNLHFTYFVFTLKADVNECIKRDASRKGALGEQATRDVFNLTSAFDYGIDIDTKGKTPDEVVRDIIKYLPREDRLDCQ